MRTAVVCIILAVVTLLPMAVLAEPTVTIYTDADTYQSGDTIEVSLAADNYGQGMSVDVYVGLLKPDGGLYTLSRYGQSGWSGNIEPWIPDIYVPPDFSMAQTPFFWFDVPCAMPPHGSTLGVSSVPCGGSCCTMHTVSFSWYSSLFTLNERSAPYSPPGTRPMYPWDQPPYLPDTEYANTDGHIVLRKVVPAKMTSGSLGLSLSL